MALNTVKCNSLTPWYSKGLRVWYKSECCFCQVQP